MALVSPALPFTATTRSPARTASSELRSRFQSGTAPSDFIDLIKRVFPSAQSTSRPRPVFPVISRVTTNSPEALPEEGGFPSGTSDFFISVATPLPPLALAPGCSSLGVAFWAPTLEIRSWSCFALRHSASIALASPSLLFTATIRSPPCTASFAGQPRFQSGTAPSALMDLMKSVLPSAQSTSKPKPFFPVISSATVNSSDLSPTSGGGTD
mmetsp:Transcript_20091/g.43813  ORF Transcript_20091/g.43813 Transcript_20091/m.43813 type:complete len:212 (-) Transcript_20091:80-715(-)